MLAVALARLKHANVLRLGPRDVRHLLLCVLVFLRAFSEGIWFD